MSNIVHMVLRWLQGRLEKYAPFIHFTTTIHECSRLFLFDIMSKALGKLDFMLYCS